MGIYQLQGAIAKMVKGEHNDPVGPNEISGLQIPRVVGWGQVKRDRNTLKDCAGGGGILGI